MSKTGTQEPNSHLVTSAQLSRLRTALADGSDLPFLIAIHDYPDPDALASALTFQTIGRAWGMDSTIVYGGGLGRPENAAMVALLNIEMRTFEKVGDLSQYKGALITDTQPAAKNHSLPPDVPVLAVIDHHRLGEDSIRLLEERRDTARIRCYDVRLDVGSSSTLALGYLEAAGMTPDARLATALFTGIKTDTDSLLRDAKQVDVEAYTRLLPLADMGMVAGISRPPLGRDYFLLLDKAMNQALVYGKCVIADCGDIESADSISIVSDLLIKYEAVEYALAHGLRNNRYYLSLRAKPTCDDATRVILAVVGREGRGGGHNLTAGGFIDSERNPDLVLAEISHRFLAATGVTEQKGVPLL